MQPDGVRWHGQRRRGKALVPVFQIRRLPPSAPAQVNPCQRQQRTYQPAAAPASCHTLQGLPDGIHVRTLADAAEIARPGRESRRSVADRYRYRWPPAVPAALARWVSPVSTPMTATVLRVGARFSVRRVLPANGRPAAIRRSGPFGRIAPRQHDRPATLGMKPVGQRHPVCFRPQLAVRGKEVAVSKTALACRQIPRSRCRHTEIALVQVGLVTKCLAEQQAVAGHRRQGPADGIGPCRKTGWPAARGCRCGRSQPTVVSGTQRANSTLFNRP